MLNLVSMDEFLVFSALFWRRIALQADTPCKLSFATRCVAVSGCATPCHPSRLSFCFWGHVSFSCKLHGCLCSPERLLKIFICKRSFLLCKCLG